jgi:2,4-dienoyl-CoA reductase (NADPH2)
MLGGVEYLGSTMPACASASTVPSRCCRRHGGDLRRAGTAPRAADALRAAGIEPHLIGGADVAAELDAKRAIDQGSRLAASL